MLDLKFDYKPPNGIQPYFYKIWYRGSKEVLKYVEYHRRPQAILDNIDVAPDMHILDIGCDWGYMLMSIQDQFPGAVCDGVDIADRDMPFAMELAKRNGYDIRLKYANAERLDFPDEMFDYVVSTETFEHFFLDKRPVILRELRRVLKPGGYLVMTTPNKYGVAEILKQFLGRFAFMRKLIPMLPKENEKDGLSPGGATKGDKMTNVAESPRSLRRLAEEAGFDVIKQGTFLFVPELTPNALMPLMRAVESVIEKIKIFNYFATTQYINARKPLAENDGAFADKT